MCHNSTLNVNEKNILDLTVDEVKKILLSNILSFLSEFSSDTISAKQFEAIFKTCLEAVEGAPIGALCILDIQLCSSYAHALPLQTCS